MVASVAVLGCVASSAAATPAKQAKGQVKGKAAKVLAVNHARVVRQVEVPDAVHLDQPPNGINGFFSDPNCQLCPSGEQSIAENFGINEPGGAFRLEQIDIWGGFFPGNTPNATDSFQILIHNDSGGVPGPVVFSVAGIQATSRVTTGVVIFGVDEYQFTFAVAAQPVLPNGNYWLQVINDTTPTAGVDWFWETGDLDATHGQVGSVFAFETPGITWNFDGVDDLAVQFNGTSVPVELQGFSIE